MTRMSNYDNESYCCCCSLRVRCLIFAAMMLGLFALADVGCFAELVKINSPEFQAAYSQDFVKPVDITGFLIVVCVICTVFVIVTVCCIAGILMKRRWMLLVFLIVFGIFVGLQFAGTLLIMISALRQISTPLIIVALIELALFIFYSWGWYSVLLLFRKIKVLARQRGMAMSLIPSAKPVAKVEQGTSTHDLTEVVIKFIDDVDIEKDGGDSEDCSSQYTDDE